jgi:hypothetical protein
MLAAESFDPRLMWDAAERRGRTAAPSVMPAYRDVHGDATA